MKEAFEYGIETIARIFTAIILIAVIAIIYIVMTWNKGKEIISEHLITPELKLTIKDNKIDTVYVYKNPN